VAVRASNKKNAVATRQVLHRLVDQLPDSELDYARRYLVFLRKTADPFLQALLEAPEDDEPTTPEEDAAAKEGWDEYLRGEGRPWEEVRKELGGD